MQTVYGHAMSFVSVPAEHSTIIHEASSYFIGSVGDCILRLVMNCLKFRARVLQLYLWYTHVHVLIYHNVLRYCYNF